MSRLLLTLILIIGICQFNSATEYHVSPSGKDTSTGSKDAPFQTISKAASVAYPGDIIIVRAGTYREYISPPRGGEIDNPIVYQAVAGEKVEIKGSEVIKNWQRFVGDVWKVSIPNSFFGDYNPYRVIISGDWFNDLGRIHHTGEVYLNGKSFHESPTLQNVIHPIPNSAIIDKDGSKYTWYCETDQNHTYIYANFQGLNPNQELVEINVRKCCFYPSEPGKDYITVRGFHMSQAATPWAPPTAEQPGLLGTHWSKGWVIENNIISDSKCVGITLGKERSTGQNVWLNNPCKDGATHYNEVIMRALAIGWSKEKIGSHIVRNNIIHSCEQAGIVGSLGAVFSEIYGNHIYNIWAKRMFTGAEMAGIKIHASIDMLIKNNCIHHTGRGIWIDWMAQGTRITGNVLYENTTDDIFSEVNHGPYLVDNNVLLSPVSLRDWSEGGAYVHNLFGGAILHRQVLNRFTPYHFAHTTEVAGLRNTYGGDNRFYNNVFVKGYDALPAKNGSFGLSVYNDLDTPCFAEGNFYYGGSIPYQLESGQNVNVAFDSKMSILEENDGTYLSVRLDGDLTAHKVHPVSTKRLGKTRLNGLPFEDPLAKPIDFSYDLLGLQRSPLNPKVGPIERLQTGQNKIMIWKK